MRPKIIIGAFQTLYEKRAMTMSKLSEQHDFRSIFYERQYNYSYLCFETKVTNNKFRINDTTYYFLQQDSIK